MISQRPSSIYFLTIALFGCIALNSTCLMAKANDGGIAYGGSPRLLNGHPSVSMTKEVIRITVGAKTLTADCQFTFTNHGPACTVRMGFPDIGQGSLDPDDETPTEGISKTPAKTTFTRFQSYVNGKPVPSKLIRANNPGEYWHSKTVQFPANQTVRIRDVYQQRIGGGIVSAGNDNGQALEVGYILHTGASWHGNIGRTEVSITFQDPKLPAKLKSIPLAEATDQKDHSHITSARSIRGSFPKNNLVVWKGPCAPIVTGRTLRFVRTNWRPAKSDDITLTYGYTKPYAE